MANITRIKAAPGIMVSVGRYTLFDEYQNIDLELLSNDTIFGIQEEYEAERIIFEDYSVFREFYDLLKDSSDSGTITEGASTEANQETTITLLQNLLLELQGKSDNTETQPVSIVTSGIQPTQLLGALLTTGENYMWSNMLSLTVINNAASTGNITLNAVGDAIVVEPGESIGWDAATSSVLSTLTITVPAGTTGRMFGTRFAPIVTEGV